MATDTKTLMNDGQRLDAEAIIRTQGRTCRGPLRDAERKAIAQLLEEGRDEEARAMDEAGRVHPVTGANLCGADFNNIIVTGPWDGAEHEYACPRCHLVGRYRAPTFATVPAVSEPSASE